MFKRLFILLMLIPLFLAACSGAESNASLAEALATESESSQGEAVQAAPTEISTSPTETPSAPATSTPVDKVTNVGLQMECTLVSNQQEAPAELEAILGVKENDWVKGPETAAVTIVEYSDFQ